MDFKVKAAPTSRTPVAFVSSDGKTLYMSLNQHRGIPDQKNCILGGRYGPSNKVQINGTGTIPAIIGKKDTPVYPGDSVTITFDGDE